MQSMRSKGRGPSRTDLTMTALERLLQVIGRAMGTRLSSSGDSVRQLLARIAMPQWMRRPMWLLACAMVMSIALTAAGPSGQGRLDPVPLLAYYYIWFDSTSWNRAKIDYPLLGRYSSDDIQVMQQHVEWAKQAGLDGFIVSWKSTDKLNGRLEKLMQVVSAEGLKLLVIYQGLDFERNPLPIDLIADDLDLFIERYVENEAFALFERPVVIWSGTSEFSRDDVAAVTRGRRERLLILASERNVDGYLRLAELVDGNAYYWSSVDPETYPGYPEKLAEMGKVVHARGGLWIAPAAPGYDARLIGGTRLVERKDGETLRRQMAGAVQSSPDAIGLISWNEFSENTHIEPSEEYGVRYLELLADIRAGVIPVPIDFGSDEPAGTEVEFGSSRLASLGLLLAIIVTSIAVIAWRRRLDVP